MPAHAHAAGLGSIDFSRYLSGGLSGLSNLAHRGQELGFTGLLPFMDDVQGGFDSHHASSSCALQWVDFACLVVIAGTIVIALRMWHQTHRRRLELAREMVAHGVEPHHGLLGLSAGNDLRRGLVLASAGLGLLAASYWASPHNISPIGLIPLFIGLGYLASARVAGPGRGASP